MFRLLPQQADKFLCDLIGWDGIGRSHGIEVYAEPPRFCGKLGPAAQPQYALSGQTAAQKIARGQSRRALIADYRQSDRHAVPQGIGKPNVAAPVGCIGKIQHRTAARLFCCAELLAVDAAAGNIHADSLLMVLIALRNAAVEASRSRNAVTR